MFGRRSPAADPSCVRCQAKARRRSGSMEDPEIVWGALGDHACPACGLQWTAQEYVVRARRNMPGDWCMLRVKDAQGVEDVLQVGNARYMELRARDVIRVHVRPGSPGTVLAVENQNVRKFYVAYLPTRWG